MIHLICGPIGAGKSTYARKLACELGAVCFSEDDWLAQLFVPDAPEGLLQESAVAIGEWALPRYERCRTQIWQVCEQLLNQGMSVVIDGSAANKAQRDVFRARAASRAVNFQLHFVTADQAVRRGRVMKRNEEQGDTYSLDVPPAVFDRMEGFFEAPEREELNGIEVYKAD